MCWSVIWAFEACENGACRENADKLVQSAKEKMLGLTVARTRSLMPVDNNSEIEMNLCQRSDLKLFIASVS